MNGKLLYQFSNKDILRQYGKGIILDLNGKRRVLSTSMLNGGVQENLKYVFNYNCLADEYDCTLTYDTYEEELKQNAVSLELDSEQSTGLSTAAFMENVSIVTESFRDISVTAAITAGIDYNAVRAGDPASYYEVSNQYTPLTPGTINILLHINHAMPYGTLVRAATICTEAKSAAIAELMLGSNYSNGIATGSGTDGLIIVSDMETSEILTDAGGHSKLGELIAICVKKAVKDALRKQTCASPARAHPILERGKRYGITIGSFWAVYTKYWISSDTIQQHELTNPLNLVQFEQKLLSYHQNSNTVIFTSLFLHLLDQYQWELLEWPEVLRETKSLCRWYLNINQIAEPILPQIDYNTREPIRDFLELYQYSIILRVLSH